ncbi:hypothetical protein RJ639_008675 [Escallonia herrerae]|uniref:Transposase Tnp1/En/Spm-like domain-containing protein n=1 Tax=Escallonia herrerae TaxID=1293975 RepID=A0AA88VT99_9ASTE|nr:hypothetical protein RJ639_008675 [Escallonia herrerae]
MYCRQRGAMELPGTNEREERKTSRGFARCTSENDILAQVMGKDKYGRVCMYGLAVSQSDDRGCEETISETSSPATSINHRPQITSMQLLCPFRVQDVVCLKSIMNPSETVAKGIIQSIDPSTQVGGEELGSNLCEVSIQVAVKKDERLIRSYGFHKTIYDAYEATIAWPCPYVELESIDGM